LYQLAVPLPIALIIRNREMFKMRPKNLHQKNNHTDTHRIRLAPCAFSSDWLFNTKSMVINASTFLGRQCTAARNHTNEQNFAKNWTPGNFVFRLKQFRSVPFKAALQP
ncbi:hypothetical protein OQJ46_10645, partial [Microbulbifer thermotolerans]|uniref:hypothetical protein n=1 Tax=Microbulbifer thermotolerans TaxID=252514 RepID=UPI00224B065D